MKYTVMQLSMTNKMMDTAHRYAQRYWGNIRIDSLLRMIVRMYLRSMGMCSLYINNICTFYTAAILIISVIVKWSSRAC